MRYLNWTKFWQYMLLIGLIYMTINIAKGQNIFWLHNVDLFFHEAGHTLFLFIGNEEAHFLGGTLSQLLAPLVLMFYFLLNKKSYSAYIMFWWLGENLTDIGAYIADARSQLLPLLGNGQHDWFYLLRKWELLLQDKSIGSTTWSAGVIIMILAIILSIVAINNSKKDISHTKN